MSRATRILAAARRAAPAYRGLGAVLAVALVVRVVVLLRTSGSVPFGDAADYDRLALSLSALGEYAPTQWGVPGSATAFRGPAYPYLLSWAYELSDDRHTVGRILGLLLGVASAGLVWGIAARLWDRRRALVAGLLFAVLPSAAWLAAGLLAENLFVPLVLAAVLATLLHRDHPRLVLPVAVGVLCGVAALTRSNGLILALPLLVGCWTARRQLRDPAIALVALVVVMAPWAIRNTHAFGRFTPTGTADGYTLSGAWNPESARGGPLFAASRNPPEVPAWRDLFFPPRFDEAQLAPKLRARALRYGREHPWFVVRATGAHLARQFVVGPGQAQQATLAAQEMGIPDGDAWQIRPPVLALVLLVLAGGVVLARRRRLPRPLWLWAVPVLLVVSTVPVVGSPRYRVTVDPFLVLAATPVIVLAAGGAGRARASRRAVAG